MEIMYVKDYKNIFKINFSKSYSEKTVNPFFRTWCRLKIAHDDDDDDDDSITQHIFWYP